MFDRLAADSRYAARQLLRAPLSTAVAVASLAIGTTVAVAAFSLVNSLVFRPLAVEDAGRVVHVFASQPRDYLGGHAMYGYSSYADIADYEGAGAFSGVVAWQSREATVIMNDVAPARQSVTFVSPGYFDVLGVDMASGRRPVDGDAFEIVISDQYRQRTFDDGDAVIGAIASVNGVDFTVIGVAPAAFRGLEQFSTPVGWVPAAALTYVIGPSRTDLADRGLRDWQVAGRLAAGVTQAEAGARLAGSARALADAYPDTWRSGLGTARLLTVATQRERALSDRGLADVLAVLAIAVAIILVLACTNVAGLLLAQSVTRRHEIAVRLALGANRRQLTAQLLTESLLLALLGGAAGVIGSRAAVGFMSRNPIFDAVDLTLDWRVLAATTALCFVCALLFGITPMGQTLRVDVKSGLTGQGMVSERGGVRGRLIALQVGLSCLLVIVGLHASRGVLSRLAAPPGVELDGLIIARLDLDTRALDSIARRHYLEHAITTLRALPGVRHTGMSSELPTVSRMMGAPPVSTPAGPVTAGLEWVDADYFDALGIPLVTGSLPDAALPGDDERSVVVNRAFAERLGGPAVGTRLQRGSKEYLVVGVVDDDGGATGEDAVPMLYELRYGWARYGGPVHLVARVEPGFEGAVMAQFVPPIRDRYPQLVPPEVGTLTAQVRELFAPLRYISNTALAIGVMQLLLAALGLYSLLLYATLARTREIGLRMALGAQPRRASLTVIKGGLYYVLGGAALGVALGVPGAIFASNSFMGNNAADPIPFAAALLAIALSTAAAAYIPARRAARVQPMAALRTE